MEARIISSGEGKVMGVMGEAGGGDGELGLAISGSGGQDNVSPCRYQWVFF